MVKLLNILTIAVIFLISLYSLAFCQETLTITTYYPSPHGSYRQLGVSGDDSPLTVTCSGDRCVDINKTGSGAFAFQAFRRDGVERWRIGSSTNLTVPGMTADMLLFSAVNTNRVVFALDQDGMAVIAESAQTTSDPLNGVPGYFPVTRYKNKDDTP